MVAILQACTKLAVLGTFVVEAVKVGEPEGYGTAEETSRYTAFIVQEMLITEGVQVAKSAIFDLGDEDSPFIVSMMLKHMYGAIYDRQILALECGRDVAVEFHIYAYTIADKYDCPSMRIAIIAAVNSELATTGAFWEDPNWCIAWISRVCGPESPQLADSTLRQVFMDWVGEHYVEFYKGSKFFKDRIVAGTLLDTQCLSFVLVKLSEDLGKTAT